MWLLRPPAAGTHAWLVLAALVGALLLACSEQSGATSDGAETSPATAADSPTTASPDEPDPPPTTAPSPGAVAAQSLGTRTGTLHTIADPEFTARSGATAQYGILAEAAYRVEMPDDWNGELVLYAHGFRGFGTEVRVGSPNSALRDALIAGGYAWAASSYSENGYTPGIGADDTLALKRFFAEEFGVPTRTYLYGVSMGGNVVALLLEHHAPEFDGALAICGALGGIEQIDYLVSWAALAEYFAGVELPIGGTSAEMTLVLFSSVAPGLGDPSRPTPGGERFASAIRALTGGPRPFFSEGLDEQFELNFGLIVADPSRELLASSAATNVGVVYGIDESLGLTAGELNATIRRFAADPEARDAARHPDAVPTTGAIGAPLITLHNTGDLFVPISHEVTYRARAEAAGAGHLLVQRAIRAPGHCKFSADEVVGAWNDLVTWIEDGAEPAGDDLSGDLSDVGREFTVPPREGDPGGR